MRDPVPGAVLLPEAQRRPENRACAIVARKFGQARCSAAVAQCDDAVGRAEIEPERGRGRIAVHDGASWFGCNLKQMDGVGFDRPRRLYAAVTSGTNPPPAGSSPLVTPTGIEPVFQP